MFLLKPKSMNAKAIMHREYKLETVKLPRERGVSVAQGACNPDAREVIRVSVNHCHLARQVGRRVDRVMPGRWEASRTQVSDCRSLDPLVA